MHEISYFWVYYASKDQTFDLRVGLASLIYLLMESIFTSCRTCSRISSSFFKKIKIYTYVSLYITSVILVSGSICILFQHTDEEIEHAYEEFYEDVHTEFLKFGEIVNFKVVNCHQSVPVIVFLK